MTGRLNPDSAIENHLDKIPNSPEEIWDKLYSHLDPNSKKIFIEIFHNLEELCSRNYVLESPETVEIKIIEFGTKFGNKFISRKSLPAKKERILKNLCNRIAKISIFPETAYKEFLELEIFKKNYEIIADCVWRLCIVRNDSVLTLGLPPRLDID